MEEVTPTEDVINEPINIPYTPLYVKHQGHLAEQYGIAEMNIRLIEESTKRM